MSGQLIVIEGASDGIGKTTQWDLLQDHLKSDGAKIVTHHFPTYYAYQGKPVEMYLSGAYGKPEELSPYFINSLYANDRAITWYIKLAPEYAKGRTILLDRYTTSSLIYQTTLIPTKNEKIKFLKYVIDFEYYKLGIQQPDLVIFLHAPLDLVTKIRNSRKQNDGIANDIHERDLDYLRQVYDNAMFVADYLGWDMINCATPSGNAMRSINSIHSEIYQHVKKVIP